MQQHRSNFLMFERFFNWYAPYFEAYSFVLARAQEYEADRCAVNVSGKEEAARALVNMKVKGRLLSEEFWPGLYGRADTQPDPPGESFSEMITVLQDPVPREKALLYFADTLLMRHRYHDTHPTLRERLTSIGYTDVTATIGLELFIPDDQTRADQFLLARPPLEFIEQQNKQWQEDLKERWGERHKFVAEADQKLAAFAEKTKTTELTVEELWERAELMTGKEGAVAALPLLQQVLALAPDHAAANYTLGEALLSKIDEAGVKHIEAAMEKDVHAIPAGCDLIVEFYTNLELDEEADKYRDCASNYYEELERARSERNNISKRDKFVKHDLTDEALAELREQLAQIPLLSAAYLVKKVCTHFPQDPGYVLGIVSKRLLGLQLDSRDRKLVAHVAENVNFSAYTYIIPLERNYKALRKIFKRIDGAEVYRAS